MVLHIEDFMEWTIRVEHFFEYMGVPETKQIPLVAFKLTGGASSWWEQTQQDKSKQNMAPIRT